MTKRGKPKERANGEGSYRQLNNGRWRGQVTLRIEYNLDGTIQKQYRKTKVFDSENEVQAWINEFRKRKKESEF